MRILTMKNQEEVAKFGISLGKGLNAGDVVALIGDLGTGKTTLTKYIAEGLGIVETITSPTFTIVKEYKSGRLPLYHFDVYRLKNSEDFFQIGGEDYLYSKGVSIIEWAENIEEALPEKTKRIFLDYGKEEGERIYRCTF